MQGHRWTVFHNEQIPDPAGPAGLIGPFWDDLMYTGNYGVFQYTDTLNHTFIIEWKRCTHASGTGEGSPETFQMIIYDPNYYSTPTGDAEILFQYNLVTNNDDDNYDSGQAPGLYSTVGMQNLENNDGLQYAYDNLLTPGAATLAAGRAIKVTTRTGRGGIRGLVDLQNGGNNQGATVTASTGQYRVTPQSGEYWLRNVPPGPVTVTASAPGYFSQALGEIEVQPDYTEPWAHFSLALCPTPSTLAATDTIIGLVGVTWNAVAHDSLLGYNIYRANWQNGEFVKLNSVLLTQPNYVDISVLDSVIYWYYATGVFRSAGDPVESFASNKDAGTARDLVGVGDDGPAIPAEFFLADNYPNPFNPSTAISYGLPKDSFVRLEVFNLLGQKVRTLLSESQRAGYRRVVWDGRDGAGNAVSSGVYFYRLATDGDFEQTKKMLLVK
jgi:hypothetical protein